ncbi:hypothetical protein [Chroococcidiopsis sp. CCMEE 29]|uniref:hypothetical protein n=1 Tax=Chroococcidiopsis sp. CCMEE 29 TaxID=155894 RepID=UPI002021C22D|nr:hypothetical protein [Chroococcidiopsis sp. CCMEE 29]
MLFAATTASDILQSNAEVSKAVSDSLSQTWKTTIEGPLYAEVAAIGAAIAVLCIGLWAANWLRATLDSEIPPRAFTELVVPILIVMLLGNPANRGTFFGQVTLGLHNGMNGVSNQILEKLSQDFSKDVVDRAGVKVSAQAIAADALKQCAQEKDENTRNACFNNADKKLQDLLSPYQNEKWAQELYWHLRDQIAAAQGSGYGNSDFIARLFGGLSTAINPITTQAAMGLLMIVGAAFVWFVQIAQLLTAILGPLFLGASLLPVPGKPIVLWLTGFLGLGLADLAYKIVVALAAITVLNSGSSDPLIFPLIAGIFGPILALGMASGGGLALFASFSRVGSFFSGKL